MSKVVTEFSSVTPSLLFKFLKKIAKVKKWDIEFREEIEFSLEKNPGSAAYLCDVSLSSAVLSDLSTLPTLSRNLKAADSLFIDQGMLLPRLKSYEALQEYLVHEAADWDNREPAFIAGDSDWARVAAGIVAALGAQRVYLIGDVTKLTSTLQTLQRFQLGVQFHAVPVERLTALDVSGGLLINTADLKGEKELFVALSYFNFLKPGSYVVDLDLESDKGELFKEAEKAGFAALSAGQFMCYWATLWFRHFFRDDKVLDLDDAKNIWAQFLSENSSSV